MLLDSEICEGGPLGAAESMATVLLGKVVVLPMLAASSVVTGVVSVVTLVAEELLVDGSRLELLG